MLNFLFRLFARPVLFMQRVELRDGDVLLVMIDQRISNDTAQRVRAHVQSVFGEDQKVLVLGDGLKIGVIGRCLGAAS